MSYAGRLARLRVRLSGGHMLADSSVSVGRVWPWGGISMHAWLRALRRFESTVSCMPWRVRFPFSSSAWKALESCSSCVPCTQLDMIPGPKVCLWYKRLCLVHCLCSYPCPTYLRCPPPFGVAAFLPSFLNLHPAGLSLAFHCLLTFLPSSVTDPRLHGSLCL
jgi:hypothetical protein